MEPIEKLEVVVQEIEQINRRLENKTLHSQWNQESERRIDYVNLENFGTVSFRIFSRISAVRGQM